MAIALSKREEILRLISELQCHGCKNVPRPTQKDRYSCINSAHTLCEEHIAKCPCGSLVGKSSSSVMDKQLMVGKLKSVLLIKKIRNDYRETT